MAESNLSRPTEGFLIFRDYEDSKYIYREQLHALICYLIANVDSYYYQIGLITEIGLMKAIIYKSLFGGEKGMVFRGWENMGNEFVLKMIKTMGN